jgi:hypothetical protein
VGGRCPAEDGQAQAQRRRPPEKAKCFHMNRVHQMTPAALTPPSGGS